MCAAIGRKSLKPEQITAIHINNGFMRKKESESTIEALNKLGLNGKCLPSAFINMLQSFKLGCHFLLVKYVDATLRFQTGMTTYQVPVDTSALAPASLLSKIPQGANASGETVESPAEMDVENNDSCTNLPPKALQGGVVAYKEIRNIPIGPLNLHVVSPEEKRQIIGDVFIRVAEETWRELKLNPDEFLLCQGAFWLDISL